MHRNICPHNDRAVSGCGSLTSVGLACNLVARKLDFRLPPMRLC